MNGLNVARAVAVTCAGLMAGLLFGDWLGPAFARAAMSDASFIQFQQIVHLNYLRTLPVLSMLALAAPIVWLILLRHRRNSREFKLLLGATVAIAIGFTITFVFNVPVNDQLETWNPAAPPTNAREVWMRWEKAHVVRTIFWMLGFLVEAIALTSAAVRQVVEPAPRTR
jgi:uncharacterized membrane protein